jgi:hypothetical protein
MFWLDGSSKLPFVPRCSYLMSNSRTRAFARAQGLIEDRAQNLKFSIEIGNFKYWCHCATELVELVIDLARRDEKYLRRDGLSTREESLRRISDLNSQFVDLICLSMFERACKRLRANSRSLDSFKAPNSRTTTSNSRRLNGDNSPLTSNVAKRGTAVTIESPLLPRHSCSRTTSTTTTPSLGNPPPLLPTSRNAERGTAVTSALPLPRHSSPPRPTPSTPTVTSGNNERRPTDRLIITTRVREGMDVEKEGEKRDERKENREMEGRKEREQMTKAGTSKPSTPPPTSDHEMGQENGDESRKRRRRCYRRRHRYCLTTYASPPTPNPGKHPPSPPHPNNERPEDNGKRRKRRRRRRRRRHPCCSPADELVSSSPPNHIPNPGKHPLPCSPPKHEHGGSRHNKRRRPHHRRHHCRRRTSTTAVPGVPPPNSIPSPASPNCLDNHYCLVRTRAPAQWPARETHEGEGGGAAGGRGRGPLYQCSPGCEPNLNPSQCAYAHCSFLRGGGPEPGIEFGGGI